MSKAFLPSQMRLQGKITPSDICPTLLSEADGDNRPCVLVTPKSTQSVKKKSPRPISESAAENCGSSDIQTQNAKSVENLQSSIKSQSTDAIFPNTGTSEMQPPLFATNCPTSTFSARAFLARVSQLLENDRDLMTPEALCFLRLHGFYHTKDRRIFYSKTLRVFLLTTTEKLSRKYLGFSPNSVTSWKDLYLIQKTSAFRKTGKECSLSDIARIVVRTKS